MATTRAAKKSTVKPTTPRNKSTAKTKATGTERSNQILGIDIGGSGIKGAPVDLGKGTLAADRLRIETPQPSTPQACAAVVNEIVRHFGTKGPIGCTYPGVVFDGVTHSAANMDNGWLECDADAIFEETCKRPFTVLNDAQAAVLAEATVGAAKGVTGMVLMLTFGTGIGSGLAYRGVAIPGVELGHLRMRGGDAEAIAAASVKDRKKLSYKKWAEGVNEYINRLEGVIWPEVIVLGGGVVEDADKWVPRLKTRTPLVVAKLGNNAGIVGAAIAATQQANKRR